MKSFKVLLAG